MAREFEVLVDSSARVEEVLAAFGDEAYWLARFDAFGVVCSLDTMAVDDDGTITVGITQDLRQGGLPGPVAALCPSGLEIRSTEMWRPDPATSDVVGELRVEVGRAPASGWGSGRLSSTDGGSQLRFTGNVQFRVPLVGGRIESYLARHFVDQIAALQRFTTAWIADRAIDADRAIERTRRDTG